MRIERYAYDRAGRLVREGNRTYRYGYLDKVLSVTDGKRSYRYAYHVDGQLARADYGEDGRAGVGEGGRAGSPLPAGAEAFLWDGLALVRRGGESFVNEPHAGDAPNKLRFGGKPRAKRSARRARKGPRGSPVASSKGAVYFNDLLGTTVGVREGPRGRRRHTSAALTAFGEPPPGAAGGAEVPSPFFTGKPEVPGLGRVFLFRNYRPGLAKWQTADPLGYPDGWNQLAYCGNAVVDCVDWLGARRKEVDFSFEQSFIEPGGMGFDGSGIVIPWYNSEYDGLLNVKKIADEIERIGTTLKEYINDWLRNKVKSALEKYVRTEIDNILVNFLLKNFNNGYYAPNLADSELQSMLAPYLSDGWEVESIESKKAFDSIQAGIAAKILTSCTYRWHVVFVKE